MANTCTLVQVIALRTGAILDLLSRAGYRAKEMPSWCSHFALEHLTETSGERSPGVFESRRGAWGALINTFMIARARVTRDQRFESRSAKHGVAR
jgi:hypothetical protein